MARATNPNLDMLETAVAQLGPLVEHIVFLGGCATGLLLTDPVAPAIRPTLDVDVISELTSVIEYHRFAEKLRERGFREDQTEDAPLCRWRGEGVILDVMPTDPKVFGFGSAWYLSALKEAEDVVLPSGASIRMVTAPYFLATKLAAFDSRGKGDYIASHDMEDILTVVDAREEFLDEVRRSDDFLRQHLAQQFERLMANRDFLEALPGHLPGDAASQARLPMLTERIRALSSVY